MSEKRSPAPLQGRDFTIQSKRKNYLFTDFFSSAPALNLATFFAEILIALPVCGLRPVLAARLATEKDPKPTRATRSPFLRAFVVALMNPSRARPDSALEIFASEAIASINSALFILFFGFWVKHY